MLQFIRYQLAKIRPKRLNFRLRYDHSKAADILRALRQAEEEGRVK